MGPFLLRSAYQHPPLVTDWEEGNSETPLWHCIVQSSHSFACSYLVRGLGCDIADNDDWSDLCVIDWMNEGLTEIMSDCVLLLVVLLD